MPNHGHLHLHWPPLIGRPKSHFDFDPLCVRSPLDTLESGVLFHIWWLSKQFLVLHDSPPWKVALCLPYPTTPSPFVDTVHSSRLCLKDGTIVSFFVSSLTDDIFVLKYSAYIQTSTSPPPLQWPPVLAFLSTRSCDSSEVGEDGMEELV